MLVSIDDEILDLLKNSKRGFRVWNNTESNYGNWWRKEA